MIDKLNPRADQVASKIVKEMDFSRFWPIEGPS